MYYCNLCHGGCQHFQAFLWSIKASLMRGYCMMSKLCYWWLFLQASDYSEHCSFDTQTQLKGWSQEEHRLEQCLHKWLIPNLNKVTTKGYFVMGAGVYVQYNALGCPIWLHKMGICWDGTSQEPYGFGMGSNIYIYSLSVCLSVSLSIALSLSHSVSLSLSLFLSLSLTFSLCLSLYLSLSLHLSLTDKLERSNM